MRMRSYFYGLLACVALGACSNDEVIEDSPKVFKGDKAYIAVNIVSAGTSTRGTGNDPNPFYYGTTNENKVNNAAFYFYDAAGKYVTKATKVPTWNLDTGTETTDNIESYSNTVVVLEGLENKLFPKYVVAILNEPDGFEARVKGQSLECLKTEALVNASVIAGDNNFVMSNSTYDNGDAVSQYFATELVESNFLKEMPTKEDIGNNYVTIYVERLAAKVDLTFGAGVGAIKNTDGLYTKVLGTFEMFVPNTDETTKTTNPVVLRKKEVKVTFSGWGLNGTMKQSYMMKNIGNDFNALGTAPNAWTWSDKGNFRSYWAHSPNYGNANAYYPVSWKGWDMNGNTPKEATLNYIAQEDLDATIGEGAAYCAENTNSETILTQNFHPVVTEALIGAQFETKMEGDTDYQKEDIYKYLGNLYTADGFMTILLENQKVYVDDENNTNAKRLITIADLKRENDGDGTVYFQLKSGDGTPTYYEKTGENYTQITDFTTINGTYKDMEAKLYNNGLMYYNIPIEHLRGGKVSFTGASTTGGDITISVEEADYGVVRNHYYRITVNSVENLGTPVADSTEPVVPSDDKETYYVASLINILSWKIVKQNVDL